VTSQLECRGESFWTGRWRWLAYLFIHNYIYTFIMPKSWSTACGHEKRQYGETANNIKTHACKTDYTQVSRTTYQNYRHRVCLITKLYESTMPNIRRITFRYTRSVLVSYTRECSRNVRTTHSASRDFTDAAPLPWRPLPPQPRQTVGIHQRGAQLFLYAPCQQLTPGQPTVGAQRRSFSLRAEQS